MNKIVMAAAALALSAKMFGGVFEYRFEMYVDGYDQLNVQGSTLQWNHVAYSTPGPVTISTSLDGVTQMVGVLWDPTWIGSQSSVFLGLTPAFPVESSNLAVTVVSGRGPVTATTLPTFENNGLLTLDFDDLAPAAGDIYDVRVTFEAASPVPEPSEYAMVGALSAFGAMIWRRHLRKSKSISA